MNKETVKGKLLPESQMKKALISFVVEQSLVEGGGVKMYKKTIEILGTKFDCDVSDCIYYPNYLVQILNDLPKKTREKIVFAIKEKLKEFDYQTEINEFVKILCTINKKP